LVGAAVRLCAPSNAARSLAGLRQESETLRVTCIHPGVVESESTATITAEMMTHYRAIALRPDAIAQAVRYAIEQVRDVDVNEIVNRPTQAVG